MAKITTLIFDWGGVLVPADAKPAAQKLATLYGCNAELLRKRIGFWEHKCSTGSDYSLFLREIEKEFHIPPKVIMDALVDTPPNEVYAWAKDLQAKYTLVVLSNQMHFKTKHVREHCDLSFFDAVFFSSEIGVQKPSPEAFVLVLRKIGRKPEECFFIDDNEENVKSAEKLGIQAIHGQNFVQLQKELRKIGIE